VPPKKPYRAWRGALELTIAGVPLPVNVEMYARVKSSRNKSFRNIAPSGQPIATKTYDPATDDELHDGDVRKGWELGKGRIVEMPKEALDEMKKAEKSKVLRPEQYAPLETIDLSTAINRYAVRPDPDVAASDQAVQIVWNGLRATGKAYVAPLTLSASNESILVIYATDDGLWAAALPFADEMYPVPTFAWQENAQAAQLFAQMVEQSGKAGPFEHDAYEGVCRTRRAEIIERVIEGAEIVVTPDEPEPQAAAPNLLELLTAAAEKAEGEKVAA
jgi:non-homologous end joining protein Ku